MIILHYTGMRSAREAIERLCDPGASVSAHYVILEDGRIMQLVEDHQRAWHAGVAGWGEIRDVNSFSIGIELVNPGHEWGLCPYPVTQMKSLVALCIHLLAKHNSISALNVLGHSDIAPSRKQDPGELFDWALLEKEGIGLPLPEAGLEKPDMAKAIKKLQSIGYAWDLPHTGAQSLIRAFQRHFLPQNVTGRLDSMTMSGICNLAQTLKSQ